MFENGHFFNFCYISKNTKTPISQKANCLGFFSLILNGMAWVPLPKDTIHVPVSSIHEGRTPFHPKRVCSIYSTFYINGKKSYYTSNLSWNIENVKNAVFPWLECLSRLVRPRPNSMIHKKSAIPVHWYVLMKNIHTGGNTKLCRSGFSVIDMVCFKIFT